MSYFTRASNSNSTFAIFVRSLKPWTFPASVLSFLLGTSLAWKNDGKFDPLNSFLTACVILLTHAAGNFVTSFYEAQNRRFFVSSLVRSWTLELNTQWAIWSYFLAIAAFACLAALSEAEFRQEFGFYATGFLASLLHGGGLKNIVLGDVLACGIFGPLSVVFTYIEQAGTTQRQLSNAWIAAYSLPFMLFTEAILHSQNTRDIKADRKAGFRTLAVLVGLQCACYLHAFFLLFPYVIIVLMAAALSPYIYIPLITLPLALNLSVVCFEGEHFTLPQKIALLDSAFGILYVLSLFWS